MSKKSRQIILFGLLLLAGLACWRCLPYLAVIVQSVGLYFPHSVTLRSAEYLRAPYPYPRDPPGNTPGQALLAPEWVRLSVEREDDRIVFESASGEWVPARLGKPDWVKGCENSYRVEAYPLEPGLTLGSLTFQQPVLVVVCDMWPAGQKVRPGRVVIIEGPLPEDDPFYLGVQCNPGEQCLAFSEGLGDLLTTVVDADTGAALADARIVVDNGADVQEFTGGFRLPLYEGFSASYQISQPGYADLVGEMRTFYGNRLDIMWFTNAEHTQGTGGDLELPGTGRLVEYTFKMNKE